MIEKINHPSPKCARTSSTKRTQKNPTQNTIFPEQAVPERYCSVFDEDFGEDSVVWSQSKTW